MINFKQILRTSEVKKLLRLTYFDDSGMFNSHQEPYVIVGGCIVHGDNQLRHLQKALNKVLEKHIPEEDHAGFVFHATNIWSGSKYFGDREAWPWKKRLDILLDLASIPSGLGLPLVYGYVERAKAANVVPPNEFTANDLEVGLFCGAYLEFVIQVKLSMRKFWPEEITILIGEENTAIGTTAKAVHNQLRNPEYIAEEYPDHNGCFPLEGIQEGCHFSPKPESAALQMADFVTFFVKKQLVKSERATRICEILEEAFIVPLPGAPMNSVGDS